MGGFGEAPKFFGGPVWFGVVRLRVWDADVVGVGRSPVGVLPVFAEVV